MVKTLLTSLICNIRGVHDYSQPDCTEQIVLQREPHNTYDGNAIVVVTLKDKNVIGRIEKMYSAGLAAVMDHPRCPEIKAILKGPAIKAYPARRTIYLQFYGDVDTTFIGGF